MPWDWIQKYGQSQYIEKTFTQHFFIDWWLLAMQYYCLLFS